MTSTGRCLQIVSFIFPFVLCAVVSVPLSMWWTEAKKTAKDAETSFKNAELAYKDAIEEYRNLSSRISAAEKSIESTATKQELESFATRTADQIHDQSERVSAVEESVKGKASEDELKSFVAQSTQELGNLSMRVSRAELDVGNVSSRVGAFETKLAGSQLLAGGYITTRGNECPQPNVFTQSCTCPQGFNEFRVATTGFNSLSDAIVESFLCVKAADNAMSEERGRTGIGGELVQSHEEFVQRDGAPHEEASALLRALI